MTGHLHGAVIRLSEISEPGALAFFLGDTTPLSPGAVLLPPRLNAEFAHVHTDGSLHLALSSEDQREVIEKGWGERPSGRRGVLSLRRGSRARAAAQPVSAPVIWRVVCAATRGSVAA
ncbi:hypothetical protein [Streptomyces kanamyceticus]|uniref:luciferase domain-containing protein n=1 Tax=Streptomyces kanamyceticus TaxID=1967 RepID=UPI0037DC3EF0